MYAIVIVDKFEFFTFCSIWSIPNQKHVCSKISDHSAALWIKQQLNCNATYSCTCNRNRKASLILIWYNNSYHICVYAYGINTCMAQNTHIGDATYLLIIQKVHCSFIVGGLPSSLGRSMVHLPASSLLPPACPVLSRFAGPVLGPLPLQSPPLGTSCTYRTCSGMSFYTVMWNPLRCPPSDLSHL